MIKEIERKTLEATIDSVTEATDAKPFGGFIARASDASTDRDGENLHADEWVTPLPDHITVDVDHGMSVQTTVGSAHPYFANGELWIDAAFSSIDRAQEVRTLVREGHIKTVSVAALVDRSVKGGKPRRELLNVGIVAIPSNRNAVITDAKGFDAFQVGLNAVLEGKSVTDAIATTQAIHDASSHLGASCATDWDQDDEDDPEDPSGTQEGANKALAQALRLRLKGLAR